MLQYGTVEPYTLDVLRRLMLVPELQDFYLVGGTALSLYYGHRLSKDLNMFSSTAFEVEEIISPIEKYFPGFTYSSTHNPIGLFGFIDNIKVDFIKYHYHPMLDTPVVEDGIRLISVADICAMKLSAILKRGVKKDFWDISELLLYYSIDDLINFYNTKFPNNQLLISIPQALTYFADADDSEDPVSLKGQTWEKVKKHIGQKVKEYLK
jgi:hypothetical protein